MKKWIHPLFAACLVPLVACGEPPTAETDPVIDEEAFLDSDAKTDQVVSGRPLRYPLLLVHGFAASPSRLGFTNEIIDSLCRDGHTVHVAALPPFEPVPNRSKALAQHVDRILSGTAKGVCGTQQKAAKVNLLAHSMGGLDSRYLVSALGYGDRVASVTTISSPHRGTAIADLVSGFLANKDDDAVNAFASFVGRTLTASDVAKDSNLRAALESMAEARIGSFNNTVRNDSRVYYQSWAGLSNVAGIPNLKDTAACENKMLGFRLGTLRHIMHIALKPIAAVVAHGLALTPNDAVVTVESAKWGEFRGCIPADHADEIGAFGITWAPFKYVDFYRLRAFELQRRGF